MNIATLETQTNKALKYISHTSITVAKLETKLAGLSTSDQVTNLQQSFDEFKAALTSINYVSSHCKQKMRSGKTIW
jgi:SOS response regulatory protein OraA/RecX